jgi:hypothetical protein
VGARVATTADGLIDALNLLRHPPSSGDAFYAGSGGDDELINVLDHAHWRLHNIEDDQHWQATSTATPRDSTTLTVPVTTA